MKVLVTGGTGFIGQWTVDALIRAGYEPLVLDHHKRGDNYYQWQGDTFYGDVRDDVAVTEAFAHADAFIHLAAVLGTQETIDNPRPAAQSNLLGGLNVLEAAAQYKTPGVYIGVGNHWMNNTYSITKTMIERFIDMFNRSRGTVINTVRAMNAYGPGQIAAAPYGPAKVRKITPSFVCRALNDDPIEIYGDGEQVSDMIYVGDVANALVRAMVLACEGVGNNTYEIGPIEHNTVNEVAETIKRIANSESEIVHLPMRPGEIPNSVVTADVSNLGEIGLDPEQFVSLEEGMTATVDYFRKQLMS